MEKISFFDPPLLPPYWRAASRAWKWSQRVYCFNSNGLSLFKRHLRWATAAALSPQEALDWFAFHDEPAIRGFSQANPRLIFRALTSYMSVRWDLARRTKVIQDTYRFLVSQGGFLEKAMQSPGGMTLAEFDLDRGQKEEAIEQLQAIAALTPPTNAVPETLSDQETARAMLTHFGVGDFTQPAGLQSLATLSWWQRLATPFGRVERNAEGQPIARLMARLL